MKKSEAIEIVLVDPDYSRIHSSVGDDFRDAIQGLISSVWEQGYDANGRILRDYGYWFVYQEQSDGALHRLGLLEDFCEVIEGEIHIHSPQLFGAGKDI